LESAGLQADILAVDINTKALEISKRMFDHNGINNVALKESNLFSAI
jgi:methylase of polypeptide subunit release factors